MNRAKFLPAVVLLSLAVASIWAAVQTKLMSVQVRTGQLRDGASFLAPVVSTLAYGERVQTQQTQGDWLQVSTTDGITGWMHRSALTPKRIVLKAGAGAVPVSGAGEELALAGKGFSADVEAAFKRAHTGIDFSWVDRAEQIVVTPQETKVFLAEGGIEPAGVGAP